MAHNRLRVCAAALAFGVIAFGLAGCGRNGAPDKPTGPGLWPWPSTEPMASAAPSDPAAVPAGQTTASKTGFDSNGNPIAPPGQKKSFLLDPILQ